MHVLQPGPMRCLPSRHPFEACLALVIAETLALEYLEQSERCPRWAQMTVLRQNEAHFLLDRVWGRRLPYRPVTEKLPYKSRQTRFIFFLAPGRRRRGVP